MKNIAFKISHKERFEKPWNFHADGGISAEIWTEWGRVYTYAHHGGSQCAPFTTVEMDIGPIHFFGNVQFGYHRRWLDRVARSFAWQCWQKAKAEGVFQ